MTKITDLSRPADPTRVVNLSTPVTKADRLIKGLGIVALVAGTIAAGAGAAHLHATSNRKGK